MRKSNHWQMREPKPSGCLPSGMTDNNSITFVDQQRVIKPEFLDVLFQQRESPFWVQLAVLGIWRELVDRHVLDALSFYTRI